MENAWARAIKLAPAQRDELLEAQATCSVLLTAVEFWESGPDNPMIETAELISGYLVPYLDSIERRIAGAQPSGKHAIVQEMVKFLGGCAQRAQRDMQSSGLHVNEGDSALRAHRQSQLFV